MCNRFATRVWHFLKREDGPTAVEYAVMVALIGLVCLLGIVLLGVDMTALFTTVSASAGQ